VPSAKIFTVFPLSIPLTSIELLHSEIGEVTFGGSSFIALPPAAPLVDMPLWRKGPFLQ
jgi:hypothetical protein